MGKSSVCWLVPEPGVLAEFPLRGPDWLSRGPKNPIVTCERRNRRTQGDPRHRRFPGGRYRRILRRGMVGG
jgi:hypothetical protein